MGREMVSIVFVIFLLFSPCLLLAGEADVIKGTVKKNGETYSFDVTVSHKDDDWKHYADKWEVVSLDGKVLATRVLHHPHVNEQPFTRRLSGIMLDPKIEKVILRAHDSIHGYGGYELVVSLSE
jgi:hypothetical protein